MEPEKQTIDASLIEIDRNNGSATDAEILETLNKDSGGILNVGDYNIDLGVALESGDSASSILDFILSGKPIREDIDTQAKAYLSAAATGLTNLLGAPMEIINSAQQGAETLVRTGINKLGGDVSTDPNDYLFSQPQPIGGAQFMRDTIESVANPIYDKIGLDRIDYVDDKSQVAEEYRPAFVAGEITGEAIAPIAAIKKLAKEGIALSVPIVKYAKDNAKKFLAGEAAVTTGGGAAAGTAESMGYGDNPYVMMGAEFAGSLGTSVSPSLITKGPLGFLAKNGGKAYKRIKSGFSENAALDSAFQQILVTADTTRKQLLKEVETATINGEVELAQKLTLEADRYTPESLIRDLQDGIDTRDAQSALGDGSIRGTNNLPSGSLSNNPAFVAIQNSLTSTNPEFSAEIMKRVNGTITGILESSEFLARAGNAEAANTLRTKAFSEMINVSLTNAAANTKKAMSAFEGADTKAASSLAQRTLFEAKDTMRKMETYLWERIDSKERVSGQTIGRTIETIQNNKLLDGMTIAGGGQVDNAINNILSRIKAGETLPISDVLKFRSIMLSNARKASAADDSFQAGIFDELATASIDELNDISSEAGDAVDFARTFSLELNKRFTRYFNKDVLSKEKTGGTTIRDTQVLGKAFGSGGEDAELNLQEMQDAASDTDSFGQGVQKQKDLDEANLAASQISDDGVRSNVPAKNVEPEGFKPEDGVMPTDEDIIPEVQVTGIGDDTLLDPENPIPEYTIYEAQKGPRANAEAGVEGGDFKLNEGGDGRSVVISDDTPVNLGQTMSEAQETFIRGKILELKGTDGGIDSQALDEFLLKNETLVNRFPELRSDIINMAEAQRTAEALIADLGVAADNKALPKAIGNVLNSDNPIAGYARLAREAITPEAADDFRNATIDHVLKGAVLDGGGTDMIKVAQALLKPVDGRKGGPNILDEMVNTEILSAEQRSAIGELLAEGLRIDKTTRDPAIYARVLAETPDMQSNLARIAGANVGVLFGRGDAGLQAASIGSGYFKKQIDALPLGKQTEQLKNLLRQPRLLLQMLSDNPTIRKTAGQTAVEYINLIKSRGIGGNAKVIGGKIADGVGNLNTGVAQSLTPIESEEVSPEISFQMEQALP